MPKLNRVTKLPLDKIVVGQIVRWKAERYMKSWDCPGIITEVDLEKETFSIKTFDTLKETTDLSFYITEGSSEFSLSDTPTAINYIKNKSLKKQQIINDLELEISNIKNEINELDSLIKSLPK